MFGSLTCGKSRVVLGGVQCTRRTMAAEFLQSLQELCPEVLSIVSDRVVRLLDSSPDEPFQDANIHEAFIDLAEAVNWTKFHVNAAKTRLQSVLVEPKKEGFKLDVNKHGKLIDALEQVSVHHVRHASKGTTTPCVLFRKDSRSRPIDPRTQNRDDRSETRRNRPTARHSTGAKVQIHRRGRARAHLLRHDVSEQV